MTSSSLGLFADDDLDLEETNIHVHKDVKFGGNVVSKIFFSLVFGALICMVGVIVFEHRGMGNEGGYMPAQTLYSSEKYRHICTVALHVYIPCIN